MTIRNAVNLVSAVTTKNMFKGSSIARNRMRHCIGPLGCRVYRAAG